jgi:3-hydroxyacyl-CoA dehydrogenase
MTQDVRTIAVIGCGVIGIGWAILFISCGLKVIISDPAEGAHKSLKRYLKQSRSYFEERGDFNKLSSNYEFIFDIMTRLPEVDFVQEVSFCFKESKLQLTILFIEWSRAC